MATTNYNIRIDQGLRDRAFSVFESYGLSPAQAIKLFLNQVADTQTVPLTFTYNADKTYNADTIAAIQEAKMERKTARAYVTFAEAMQHLNES